MNLTWFDYVLAALAVGGLLFVFIHWALKGGNYDGHLDD